MKRSSTTLALALLMVAQLAQAQVRRLNPERQPTTTEQGTLHNHDHGDHGEYENGENGRLSWGRDTTARKKAKEIPIGQHQWILDERLGTVIPAENIDTVVHNFQNYNLTDGYTGQYTILGNLGSPRINRIFLFREPDDNFIFLQPFSHFRESLRNFRFTNTLSPITNLAYHSLGSSELGEDRVRAYFATNINKRSGIGFKLDYLYGRGYYNSQQNSMFGGTLYGYHQGERYQMHAYFNASHLKMAENGGVENDLYIRDPQSFQQNYNSKDIPVMLTSTWNRNDEQTFYLTNRYHLGFEREIPIPDSLQPKPPTTQELLMQLSDSIRTVLQTDSIARQAAADSLLGVWQASIVPPTEFVPVTSISHTLDIRHLDHEYIAKANPGSYFTHHYYGDPAKVNDLTDGLSVRNTLGLSQCEGFSRWAAMGLTAFASHTLRSYTMPEFSADTTVRRKWTENDISVGGQIARTQGQAVHYNVNAEFWLAGPNVGDFAIDGDAQLHFKTRRQDSIQLHLSANIEQRKPGFYQRHYHSQFTWWDNTHLSRQWRTRVQGRLSYSRSKTALTIGFENVKNYTHYAIAQTLLQGSDSTTTVPTHYSRAVQVRQHGGNVQVFTAMLQQNFKLGPLHWENEITYQKSSQPDVLPLPQLNAYTNLFLLFRIAKVLRVQLGADMRYFTKYYAPSYAPSIGQWATQDTEFGRIQIGNYPIINVYANLHLKNCRIYAGVNHVNAGSGNAFWAPHYAINPLTFRFGVSWNFFN